MANLNDMAPLTDAQREAIVRRIFYEACLRLRAPGYAYFWRAKEDYDDIEKVRTALRRSIVFGEALHNLARFLWDESFSFGIQKMFLEAYSAEVPELREFIEELERIEAHPDGEREPSEDNLALYERPLKIAELDENGNLRVRDATQDEESEIEQSWEKLGLLKSRD